ncbi:MAG: hypothetical protein JWP26_79 [Devosia sp.]|uniref:hypothetical protein n=1 Tax=Devosia sp. TaxID=1871048 RepID=UPI00261E2555|nr:hypothetical protein [Devosia sp.]MDB5585109.1 hypothetical protein [Devosia sp.]
MTNEVYRYPKAWLVALAAALLGTLAWWSLANPGSGRLAELCGANGVFAFAHPWDEGRLVGLVAMWAAMMTAMLVPCRITALVSAGWRWRSSYGFLTASLAYGIGHLCLIGPIIVAAAAVEWAMESLGLLVAGQPPDLEWQIALIVVAVGLLLAGSRVPSSTAWGGPLAQGVSRAIDQLPVTSAMICLQLAGGSMNLAWMVALTLGMVVLERLMRGHSRAASTAAA